MDEGRHRTRSDLVTPQSLPALLTSGEVAALLRTTRKAVYAMQEHRNTAARVTRLRPATAPASGLSPRHCSISSQCTYGDCRPCESASGAGRMTRWRPSGQTAASARPGSLVTRTGSRAWRRT